MFISHYHDPNDGFANFEEESVGTEDDRASEKSVVHLESGKRSRSPKTISLQPEVRLRLNHR